MSIDLSSKAMLVTLCRRQWGGERTDRIVGAELAAQKGASKRSSRVVKKLLPPEALGPVHTASNLARQTHYRYSLPWRDSGPRILRSAIYGEYIAKIREAKDACTKAEEEFYSKYDVYKAAGMAELGDMVNEADYPTLARVRAMFDFALDVTPIPVGDDFRVDTPDAVSIKEAISDSTQKAAEAGMKAKLTEAAAMVRHMAERMAAYTPGTEGRRATGTFKDSLVDNIQDLAIMLPKINLFDDPEIDAIAKQIGERLGSYHPEELRDVENNRRVVQREAEDILSKLEGYL